MKQYLVNWVSGYDNDRIVAEVRPRYWFTEGRGFKSHAWAAIDALDVFATADLSEVTEELYVTRLRDCDDFDHLEPVVAYFGDNDSPNFPAMWNGKRWNGWADCWITPETHAELVRTFPQDDPEAAAEFAALPVHPDCGLISLNGYTVSVIGE